jgi:hypothetical protein
MARPREPRNEPKVSNFGSRGKMDKCTYCAGGGGSEDQVSQPVAIYCHCVLSWSQEQANAMAARDSLDHNALAPFSSRIGRSGFSRTAENIAYGHTDFASTLEQWTNSNPRGWGHYFPNRLCRAAIAQRVY